MAIGPGGIEDPDVPGGPFGIQISGPGEAVDEPGTSAELEMDMAVAEASPDISGSLREIHAQVVASLRAGLTEDMAAGRAVALDVSAMGNVQGVGFSPAEGEGGGIPGEPALTLYVAEPMSVEGTRRSLVDSAGVSALTDDRVPMNVVVTGVIDALGTLPRSRMRPAPGGVSVGHYQITAGTLGCFARGRTAPRSNRVLMLSNNHVIANSNNARVNDNIIQPGAADGGVNPADRIAVLEQFVPINFAGGVNYVDAATGWCWSNLVRFPDLMYQSGAAPVYFRVSPTPVAARVGLSVGKSGRTTQLTQGTVTDVNATIRVNYGFGRVALFSDQIAIRGVGGNFSAGGDSGSLIWTRDARRSPVGLLFAGGGNMTFANKIPRVLSALDIVIRS